MSRKRSLKRVAKSASFSKATPKWAFARIAAIQSMTASLEKFVPDGFKWEKVIDWYM